MSFEKEQLSDKTPVKEKLIPKLENEEAFTVTNPETAEREEYRSYLMPMKEGEPVKIEEIKVFDIYGTIKNYTLKADGEVRCFEDIEAVEKINSLWESQKELIDKPIAIEIYEIIKQKLKQEKEKYLKSLD